MLQNVLNVSICFHSEAPSKNPTRKVAHSLHYPVDVTITVSHFSLVSYLPCVGRGSKLCNEVQDTAPKFPAPAKNKGMSGRGVGGRAEFGGWGIADPTVWLFRPGPMAQQVFNQARSRQAPQPHYSTLPGVLPKHPTVETRKLKHQLPYAILALIIS